MANLQIQISWLLQKPTDLDLHCLQRKGISRFSRSRVKMTVSITVIQKWTWMLGWLQTITDGQTNGQMKKWTQVRQKSIMNCDLTFSYFSTDLSPAASAGFFSISNSDKDMPESTKLWWRGVPYKIINVDGAQHSKTAVIPNANSRQTPDLVT